ncbi:MAG: hypothetical protein ACOVQ6_03825 [Brevundimonas sp.]
MAPIAIHLNLNGPLSPATEAALLALIRASTAHLMAMGGEEVFPLVEPAAPEAKAAPPEPVGSPRILPDLTAHSVQHKPVPPAALNVDREPVRSWTKEQVDRLIELVRQGKTDGEIGDVLGRRSGAVSWKIHQLREKGVVFPTRTNRVYGAAPVAESVAPAPATAAEAPEQEISTAAAAPVVAAIAPPPAPIVRPKPSVAPAAPISISSDTAAAAVRFLNAEKKYSIFARGPDKWLMNGLRTLNDADVVKKAQNFGWTP